MPGVGSSPWKTSDIHEHGILVTQKYALTGRTIADLITTGQLTPVSQPFGLARFNKHAASIEEL